MNFFKKLAAGLIAIATVGSATASTVGDGALTAAEPADYAGGYTIASEALVADYVLDIDSAAASPLGNAVGTNIRFVPSFGLNSGDIITLTFSGALYTGANVKLVAEEAATQQVTVGAAIDVNNDGDAIDVVEVASNFGTVDAVAGVSTVQMRINNGLILPTGIHLVLQVAGANAEDDDDGVLDDETDNATFLIPAGTGGNICVTSSGVTSGAIAIPAATNTNDGFCRHRGTVHLHCDCCKFYD
jgi:hypothetical protein